MEIALDDEFVENMAATYPRWQLSGSIAGTAW
jgi:hypothetical protein